MADKQDARTGAPPGIYDRNETPGSPALEIAGAAVAVLWVGVAAAALFLGDWQPADARDALQALMIVALPAALIGVAVASARSARQTQAETARLRTAVDALRQAYVAQAQQGRADAMSGAVLQRLDAIAAAQIALETRLGAAPGPAASVAAVQPAPAAPGEHQPTLSLGTPPEAQHPPPSTEDFIRALHFPETAQDRDGFAALRRALKDRPTAHLIQASQDVLTLLSQDGIYMDDLSPDLARPDLWRAFAQGARGREIAGLGGVHDEPVLARAARRMKADPIFRDAVHHFLRRFDTRFAAFEQGATDADLTRFAGTRTARAFMLLGRIAGTFD